MDINLPLSRDEACFLQAILMARAGENDTAAKRNERAGEIPAARRFNERAERLRTLAARTAIAALASRVVA